MPVRARQSPSEVPPSGSGALTLDADQESSPRSAACPRRDPPGARPAGLWPGEAQAVRLLALASCCAVTDSLRIALFGSGIAIATRAFTRRLRASLAKW